MRNLRIKQGDQEVELSKFQFNKGANTLMISSEDGGLSLILTTPFKIGKIKDPIFDISQDIDEIITMRNHHFGEYNLINIQHKNDTNKTNLGAIFSLSGLLHYEDYFKENKHLIPYASRALVSLMHGNSNYKPKPVNYRSDGDYSLLDWYPEDSIICALSKEVKVEINSNLESSLYYYLNSLGFYILTKANVNFYPKHCSLQQQTIHEVLGDRGTGNFQFSNIESSILEEPYLKKYIRELINENLDPINRFILIYQCYEILINYVLDAELRSKVCDGSKRKGHKLKELIYDISTESYRLKKLIKKYSNFPQNSDFECALCIENLFEKYKPELITEKSEYSSLFYKFRNQIVHNLRFFYEGNESEVNDKQYKTEEIIKKSEYMTIETIINLNMNTSI